MAKAKAKKGWVRAARRVTIPAGKDYVTFAAGSIVHIAQNGEWPQAVIDHVDEERTEAYRQGFTDAENKLSKQVSCRSYTVEESIKIALDAIRQHHFNDQNKIVAVVLNALKTDLDTRIRSIEKEVAHKQELLKDASTCLNTFEAVKAGNFDALNLR